MRTAIAIPLIGKLLQSAQEAWEILEEEFGAKAISDRFVSPHITLSGGVAEDREDLLVQVSEFCKTIGPFELEANGLGIFCLNSPHIHIRFKLGKRLLELRSQLLDRFTPNLTELEASLAQEVWQPKASLCWEDVTYDRLGSVVERLRKLNFYGPMPVTQLQALSYGSEQEEELLRIRLR